MRIANNHDKLLTHYVSIARKYYSITFHKINPYRHKIVVEAYPFPIRLHESVLRYLYCASPKDHGRKNERALSEIAAFYTGMIMCLWYYS